LNQRAVPAVDGLEACKTLTNMLSVPSLNALRIFVAVILGAVVVALQHRSLAVVTVPSGLTVAHIRVNLVHAVAVSVSS